jgi:hypothetical protein
MRGLRLAVLLAIGPAAALAQGAGALGAARKASATQAASDAARMRAADEAVSSGDPQPGVDLSRAAEQLEAGDAADPGAQAQAKAPASAAAPDAYTVKPGDTLWDLSGRYLNNPWYWPKIWSYNPAITNPHWIFPGATLRFFKSGDEAPGRVEPLDVADGDGDGVRAPRELEGFSRADTKKPQDYGDGDEVAVVGPYKIGHVPARGVYARRDSFVTRHELEESGVISAAFEEKGLLSIYDRAYAKFSKAAPVRVGDSYVLYRTDREVTHPVTHEVFGWQSTIIGAAKVVAVDDRAATIDIIAASEPIERGAYLGPWTDKLVKQVQRRDNARDLQGYIIAAQQDVVTEIGEHHLVFIDKGRNDGVEEGNVFTVTRSGDPTAYHPDAVMHDAALPIEDVGSLMIVDAKPTASTALVVRSVRELLIGDHVVMRAAGGLAAGARSN